MRQHLQETVNVNRGVQRLRELIIYVSSKSVEDPSFGAIKLNKILYHSDFTAFERFCAPLTGARYQKIEFGPAPKSLLHVRQALIDEGAIKLEIRDTGIGYDQHRTIALREPALELFTNDEIALVDEIIEKLWDQTAMQVSDASHDVRWNAVNMGDPMPYELAYLSSEPLTDHDQNRTEELAAKLGW